MGIAERKEREKEQRRNDIIDAAERVFFSKGITSATMDDVAEEAELSKGTLYLYFKSKEELYFAINSRGLALLGRLLQEASQKAQRGIEKVYAIGQAYVEFSQKHPNYFNAFLYYESREIDAIVTESIILEECAHIGFQALQILIDALETGVNDGSIHPAIDPAKTALILWGYTWGIIQLVARKGAHLQEKQGIDIDGLIPYAFDFIRRTLENA